MADQHLRAFGLALVLFTATAPVSATLGGTTGGMTAGLPLIELTPVATGLAEPLLVTNAGDGSDRLFIAEKGGTVRVMENGVLLAGDYLDITDRVSTNSERGLLGLAFHPDFETNGYLYVSYTDTFGTSKLVRHQLGDPANDAPGTAPGTQLLSVAQPFANHNGGHIAFGPDAYLYYGLGDGGSAGDPFGHGQDTTTLLGSLLRLDVDEPGGLAVPPDNPFVGQAGRDEIWAYGLRNPWRFSFDRATGDLWIADVGQNLVEEVNVQGASSSGGENYGWNTWEGLLPYVQGGSVPTDTDVTFPVLVYPHTGLHCSVTGGHVYRGEDVRGLEGVYVFGDFCGGTILGALASSGAYAPLVLAQTTMFISSFGEDERGELYVVDIAGTVSRIDAALA